MTEAVTFPDDANERYIKQCGINMRAAYARYEITGCFSDRGDSDRWRGKMEDAIKARSAAQVAAMEQERGLNVK